MGKLLMLFPSLTGSSALLAFGASLLSDVRGLISLPGPMQ